MKRKKKKEKKKEKRWMTKKEVDVPCEQMPCMYVVGFSSIMTAMSLLGWSITALRLREIFGSRGKMEKRRRRRKKKKKVDE